METLAIHPKDNDQLAAIKLVLKAMKIPFEKVSKSDTTYNSEFIAKIAESQKQIDSGDYDVIDTKDLWK